MTFYPSERSTAIGNVIAGKLRIVRVLGEGGMGAVYEVEHEITRHRRALKLLHHQMAEVPGVVERFLREASAAGRIGNPHIVETFDAGRLDTGEPYIVMELLRGKSLAEKLNETGPLDVTTACEILIQTCDGVAAAHAAGIIHRDLKPENLFLVGPDCSYVKILDFGISKFDAAITGVEGFTIEGSPIGTPFYMSPEQVRGQKTVDVCTDVYALGVVLYECLTHRRPFDADNLPYLIYLISQGQYAPPSSLRPSLPRALDAIVAKALALDRAERYASAQELSQAIARLRQSLAPPSLAAELPPSVSILPQPETHRSVPAFTPDVFSNSALMNSPPSAQAKSKRGLYVVLGGVAITVGIAVILATVMRDSDRSTAASVPADLNNPQNVLLPSTSASLRAKSSVDSTVEVIPLPAATVSIALPPNSRAAAPQALSSSIAPTLGKPNASTPSAKPLKPEAPEMPKNRAASVGLSQDNPFK